jgi:hypothetical protein
MRSKLRERAPWEQLKCHAGTRPEVPRTSFFSPSGGFVSGQHCLTPQFPATKKVERPRRALLRSGKDSSSQPSTNRLCSDCFSDGLVSFSLSQRGMSAQCRRANSKFFLTLRHRSQTITRLAFKFIASIDWVRTGRWKRFRQEKANRAES